MNKKELGDNPSFFCILLIRFVILFKVFVYKSYVFFVLILTKPYKYWNNNIFAFYSEVWLNLVV